MKVTHTQEAHTAEGEPVYRFRITNDSGAYVELTNWGARWIAAVVPDKNNQPGNVIVGYDELTGYLSDTYYMGATVGRFANRIAGASFCMDGKEYRLETNDGANTNHGGFSGFHQRLWQWEELPDGVCFTLCSPDGEGGYPGNLQIGVTYRWNNQNELSIDYHGTADQPTYLNMTNHAYFNLNATKKKITGHYLQVPATKVLDTTNEFIPTGKEREVNGTPFDFTRSKSIGTHLYMDDPQLIWNKGYNHCYILKESPSSEMLPAARLYDPETGRVLTVVTDLPGVLLYTAGYYPEPDTAVCLEVQYFPDTPSHPHFPSCLLRPGEVYRQRALYGFSVQNDINVSANRPVNVCTSRL